jgi:nicotinate-nucleotide adenylyltransferase
VRIGLFGGSFDPIHLGHLIVGRAVAEALGLEELRFMPTGEQPLKRGRHAATAAQRAAMVAAAVEGEPVLTLERIEADRPGPSYTVETLRALRAREPGREFVVLLGADAAAELEQWHEVAALPGLARLVAFTRAGSGRPAHPLLDQVVEAPAVEISSTAIRQRVAAGRSIRYLVPDAVAEYIAAQGLYRNGPA